MPIVNEKYWGLGSEKKTIFQRERTVGTIKEEGGMGKLKSMEKHKVN